MLYPIVYRYKRELSKWLPVVYLLVFAITTPLLYMGKLGPFNPAEPAHYRFALTINFLLAAFVNETITIWVNCFQYLVSTIIIAKAECDNPYEEI